MSNEVLRMSRPVNGATLDRDRVLLDIRGLQVEFRSREGRVRVLRGIDLELRGGETLGIVGESGCGKSMTARSVLGIIPSPGRVTGGQITYHPADGSQVEITGLPEDGEEIRRIRGGQIGMIFQEPMASLSPVHTVGNQIMEAIYLHVNRDRVEARRRAIEALRMVGIPNPASRIDDYPFQMSGGMRQRVMLAMAVACEPRVLLADEPTTALDVTTQAQILALLKRLQRELGLSVVLITHDLGVIAAMADRVAVMYVGRIVEEAPVGQLFASARHPYTVGLLNSVPRLGATGERKLVSIAGAIPDMRAELGGCPFHPRCPHAVPGLCDVDEPGYHEVADAHRVRCVMFGDERVRHARGGGAASLEEVQT